MNQKGGTIPLDREQQEVSHLRQGEQLMSTKKALSRILAALIEQYGLDQIKAELAEMERKIELVERQVAEVLLLPDDSSRYAGRELERYMRKLRNG